jgi:hypothetical protein
LNNLFKRTLLSCHFFFQRSDLVTQLGSFLKFLLMDPLLQLELKIINFSLQLNPATASLGYFANVYGIPMHSFEKRIQAVAKIFITGTTAEPANFAKLGIRHSAFLAPQSLWSFDAARHPFAGGFKIKQSR